jgi:hypothetical protein
VKNLINIFQNPKFLRHFHGWVTCIWICLLIPSLLFWSQSVTWVVLMSVWANIAGHWSAWQAARAEENGNEE